MNPIAQIARPTPVEYWFDEGCHILECWNDPADGALSIARARVPAGCRTAWHALDGVTERYLVQSGRGVVEVGELPPRELVAGDVVLIPPGVRQRVRADAAAELVFLAVCTPRFTPACYRALESGPDGAG